MSIAEKVLSVLFIVLVVLLHVQILQDVKDEYLHVTGRVAKLTVVRWAERVRLRYAHAIAGAIAGWKSVAAPATPASK